MKKILRSRLPERLADKVPPLLVEIAIGISVPALLTLIRVPLLPLVGDRAPFAHVYVAMVGATVLGGWRSGLLALVVGQLLAWYVIVDPATYAIRQLQYVESFVISTLSQLFILVIVWLYQREVARALSRREDQVQLMEKVLREIDHRTKNNYQTMMAVVLAQAKAAKEPAVKDTLHKVVDRLRAIGDATARLAHSSENLDLVRLSEHLRGLCAQIERGLFPAGVRLECDSDDVSVDADRATCISILVNELATNALKHAFPNDRHGTVRVELKRSASGLELIIADDGVGMARSAWTRGSGLGNKLVDTFTEQLGAQHEVETDEGGTRHRFRFSLAG